LTNKILSIFIDESGTFSNCESHDDKYVVGLVFHDQDIDISANIRSFKEHLKILGKENHFVHTAPLIRREPPYENDLMEDRVKLFSSLFNCARKMPVAYSHILIHKREWNDVMRLNLKLSKELGQIISTNSEFFRHFDSIVIYYDHGQAGLTKVITSVFGSQLPNVDVRKVHQIDYLLLQIADLTCTMELLAEKLETHSFTKSELDFFKTHRDFKKNYLKWFQQKRLH
jgi:hypothetical protein